MNGVFRAVAWNGPPLSRIVRESKLAPATWKSLQYRLLAPPPPHYRVKIIARRGLFVSVIIGGRLRDRGQAVNNGFSLIKRLRIIDQSRLISGDCTAPTKTRDRYRPDRPRIMKSASLVIIAPFRIDTVNYQVCSNCHAGLCRRTMQFGTL